MYSMIKCIIIQRLIPQKARGHWWTQRTNSPAEGMNMFDEHMPDIFVGG